MLFFIPSPLCFSSEVYSSVSLVPRTELLYPVSVDVALLCSGRTKCSHALSLALSLSLSLTRSRERMSAPLLVTPPLSLSLTPSSLGCVPCFLYSLLPNLSLYIFPRLSSFLSFCSLFFFYPLIYFYPLSNLFCLPCLHPLSLSIPPLSF